MEGSKGEAFEGDRMEAEIEEVEGQSGDYDGQTASKERAANSVLKPASMRNVIEFKELVQARLPTARGCAFSAEPCEGDSRRTQQRPNPRVASPLQRALFQPTRGGIATRRPAPLNLPFHF